MPSKPIRVAVTGGAGQLGYSLLFRIAAGDLFGPQQPVALSVQELPVAMDGLKGVALELEDCAFPLLTDIRLTSDVNEAMRDANWALLVGAKPRGPGMERGDLIRENGPIFTAVGKALNEYAAPDVRVLVVGNPCNTNCLIAMHHAPKVPRARFHAMTRLDQNRAVFQLAKKAGVPVAQVKNLVIWGNHSATQVPDYLNARVGGQPASELVKDLAWLRGDFNTIVGQRGAEIIKARGKSSAASAANAIVDAVRSLVQPTPAGDAFSSAICSDGNPYGVPEGLIFSFPCAADGKGGHRIVPGFARDEFLAGKLKKTTDELVQEREIVKALLG